MMFTILMHERYCNLSNDNTEYAILDRLSFIRFLGLGINQPVPNAKTICFFRDKLSAGGMVNKLFRLLDMQMDKGGIIVHKGKLVDTFIVEVPIQRNTCDENKELKEGNIPEDWDGNKLRQKDTDAQWVSHNGRNYFGNKNHNIADRETKLITGYPATKANIHDSEVMDVLLDKEEDMIRIFKLIAPTVARRLNWFVSKKRLRAVFTKKDTTLGH